MNVERQDATNDFADKIVRWAGAYLISFVGLLHLIQAGEHFAYATYLGILFLANFAASAVSALGIVWTGQKWAWLLGVTVAAGSLVSLIYSRAIGLPGFPEGVGQWFNFLAWMAVAFDVGFLNVAPLALTSRGSAIVETEQRRIDREDLPPARQETPEHFEVLEEEMADIRERADRDLTDLRQHMDPQTLKDEAKRDLQGSLHSALKVVRNNPRTLSALAVAIGLLVVARSAKGGKDT